MRSRPVRSGLIAIASLIVAGTFVLAANVAAGNEPADPQSLPDSAFAPVSLPPGSPDPLEALGEFSVPVAGVDTLEIRDPWLPTPPPDRVQPDLPASSPVVVAVPKPAPKTTHALRGYASYYCRAGVSPCTVDHPDVSGVQAYAAAGPKLRAALGSDWRGSIVYVDGIRVKLIDWCQCYHGESNEKLLDLYYDVFKRTGSPVTIRW